MRVAAIDVGTNTTRLLIAETGGGPHPRQLDRRLRFTRLGEGVDAAGRINPQAVKRTVGALADFLALCSEFEVEKVRVAGTSALRDAVNSSDFLDAVTRLTGQEPVVLSGEEEARLSFLGATEGLNDGVYLVCDIGGGSTEFVGGKRGNPEGAAAVSLDLGAVRLTERYLLSDPPAPEEMLSLEAAIETALPAADAAVPGQEAMLVGLAGTVTTLAAVSLGLDQYEPEKTHHFPLTLKAVETMYLDLAQMTSAERSAIPGMEQGRADVIVAGTAILVGAMRRWSFERVIVSEKDILDGLVLEIMGGKGGQR